MVTVAGGEGTDSLRGNIFCPITLARRLRVDPTVFVSML